MPEDAPKLTKYEERRPNVSSHVTNKRNAYERAVADVGVFGNFGSSSSIRSVRRFVVPLVIVRMGIELAGRGSKRQHRLGKCLGREA